MRVEALRYIESKNKSYWEVRTEEGISQYNSLRSFGDIADISHLAQQAIRQSGLWLHVAIPENALLASALGSSSQIAV